MIDASRSPRPLWKRVTALLVLASVIVAAAWVIWVKELHHSDVHLRVYQPVGTSIWTDGARARLI
ncbi:MAG TPA: hypothetical protein VNF71_08120 [Acidimicrobiales bacterium]|nr:hypothetical protein [Acidimicrobiales bacterium]